MRFALLLLLLPVLALAQTDRDPMQLLLEKRAEEANKLAPTVRGAAALIRLHALRDEVEDLRPLAKAEQNIAFGPHVNPLVRALAKELYLDLEKGRGHLPRGYDTNHQLGFLHDFYVLGGFDNESKAGCNTDFGPEKKIDLRASYPLRGHETLWHRVTLDPVDGYIDLSGVVSPSREAVAYALTYLDAEQDKTTTLALGTSGGYRLWLNGQLASKEDHYNLARPDQARVTVKLHKGLNKLLLKICQDTAPLGFYLRAEGGTVKATLPEVLPADRKASPAGAHAEATLTSLFAQVVKEHPKDAVLRAQYAVVLNQTRAFDERDHAALVEAERAARELDPKSPDRSDLELIAARLQTEDLNVRRDHLEAALAADPQNFEASLALAQHELGTDHPDRARVRLRHLLDVRPEFAAPSLLLARVEEDLGDWPQAVQRLEAQFHATPRLPTAVRDAVRVSRRLERPQEMVNRLRVALALRYDDVNSRKSLAGLLADIARVDEAVTEYQTVLRIDPFDNATRLKLAELECANDRVEDGLALFKEARGIAPDEAETYEHEGRALLSLDRKAEAMGSFERALVLKPQSPGLREVVRALKGDNNAAGVQYALEVKPLTREADSYAGEDAITLVNYTFVRVQSSGLSSTFRQLGVKVYSDRGVEAFRSFPIQYSPTRQEVRIVRARVTKPDGSMVESYGDTDRNMNEPWSGMYYDVRAKILSFPALAKGDTLELQYRLEDTAQDNLLSDYWGDVDFVQGMAPILRYQFYVDMPASRPLYWNQGSLPKAMAEKQEDLKNGRTLYRWNMKSVPKITPEPQMPGYAEVASTLHVSTYKTWDQVGRYYWGLVRDQLTPTDELRQTVDRVLKPVNRKDELAVTRALYDFVVTNTRYVALEFGIHGYKPYRVDRILARRFGDCKDKASLIHALLKIAGVDSRLVLLRMRTLGALSPEPASLAAFNHAIVYVPKFDLYLDGTAEFTGARELPSADHLANALIVEPEGNSRFLTTPEARAADNAVDLTFEVALKADGSAELQGKSRVTGASASGYRRSYQSVATRKSTFEEGWGQIFPGLTVQKMAVSDLSKLEADVSLDYTLAVPRYAEVLGSGGLRAYPYGSGRGYAQSYAPLTRRQYDLVLDGPWTNTFHVRYSLPPGFTPGALPPDVEETSPFGHLKLSHSVENGKILFEGEVALTQARIRAEDYPAFRAFLGRLDQSFSRKFSVVSGAQTAGTATMGSGKSRFPL